MKLHGLNECDLSDHFSVVDSIVLGVKNPTQFFKANMALFQDLGGFSIGRLSFLLVATTFLVPLINKIPTSVSAADIPPEWGPDQRYNTPKKRDYPEYEDMLKVFTPPGENKAVVWSDFRDLPDTDVEPARYASVSRKKWLFDCFPRDSKKVHYLQQNGRSRRFYTLFVAEASLMYIRSMVGDVFLLSRWPKGPRKDVPQCNYWFNFEEPLIKRNINVKRIWLVNVRDYKKKKIYWDRDKEPNGDEETKPDASTDGDGDGNALPDDGTANRLGWSGLLNAQSAVLGTLGGIVGTTVLEGGAGAGTLGVGASAGVAGPGADAVLGLGDVARDARFGIGSGTGLPGVDGLGPPPVPAPKTKEQNSALMTDPLDNIIGESPPADDPSATGELEAMAGTDTSYYPLGLSRRDRRRRALLPRSSGFCWDWNNWPPQYRPSDLEATDLPAQPNSISPQGVVPYPAAAGGSVTVYITQYQKASLSAHYVLDIRVLDPVDQIIADERGVDAPAGVEQKVEIKVLPIPLYVWTGEEPDDPIFFRYGNDVEEWNGNDVSEEHQCKFDSWKDGKREGHCGWNY